MIRDLKNNIKKITSLLLVAAMIVTMNTSVFANEKSESIGVEETEDNQLIEEFVPEADESEASDEEEVCPEIENSDDNGLIEGSGSVTAEDLEERLLDYDTLDPAVMKHRKYLAKKYPELDTDKNGYLGLPEISNSTIKNIEIKYSDYPDIARNMVSFNSLGYFSSLETLTIDGVDEIRSIFLPPTLKKLVIKNTELNLIYTDGLVGGSNCLESNMESGRGIPKCPDLEELVFDNVIIGKRINNHSDDPDRAYDSRIALNIYNAPNLNKLSINVKKADDQMVLCIDAGSTYTFEKLKSQNCSIPEDMVIACANSESFFAKNYPVVVDVPMDKDLRETLMRNGVDLNGDEFLTQEELDTVTNFVIDNQTTRSSVSARKNLTDLPKLRNLEELTLNYSSLESYGGEAPYPGTKCQIDSISFPESLRKLHILNATLNMDELVVPSLEEFEFNYNLFADDKQAKVTVNDTGGRLKSLSMSKSAFKNLTICNGSNNNALLKLSVSECVDIETIKFTGKGYTLAGDASLTYCSALKAVGSSSDDVNWTVDGSFENEDSATFDITGCTTFGAGRKITVNYDFSNEQNLKIAANQAYNKDNYSADDLASTSIDINRKGLRPGNISILIDKDKENVLKEKYYGKTGYSFGEGKTVPDFVLFKYSNAIRKTENTAASEGSLERWIDFWDMELIIGGTCDKDYSFTYYVLDYYGGKYSVREIKNPNVDVIVTITDIEGQNVISISDDKNKITAVNPGKALIELKIDDKLVGKQTINVVKDCTDIVLRINNEETDGLGTEENPLVIARGSGIVSLSSYIKCGDDIVPFEFDEEENNREVDSDAKDPVHYVLWKFYRYIEDDGRHHNVYMEEVGKYATAAGISVVDRSKDGDFETRTFKYGGLSDKIKIAVSVPFNKNPGDNYNSYIQKECYISLYDPFTYTVSNKNLVCDSKNDVGIISIKGFKDKNSVKVSIKNEEQYKGCIKTERISSTSTEQKWKVSFVYNDGNALEILQDPRITVLIEANGTTYEENFTMMVDTISFSVNCNSNEHVSLNTYVKTVLCGKPYGELPVPGNRTGYDFDGWYTESVGGTKTTSTTLSTGTRTLYAHWIPHKQILTYDVNGGNAIDYSTKNVTYDAKYGDLPIPTRLGFIFAGWSTDRDIIDGAHLVTADTVCKGDATIYAHWTGAECRISFNSNDVPLDAEPKTVRCGEAAGVLPKPEDSDGKVQVTNQDGSKTTYKFLGWYTSRYSGTRVDAESIITGNMTLFAHWDVDGYGVAELADEEKGQIGINQVPDSLWIAGVPDNCDYNGSAITFPNLHVYWNKRVALEAGKDYTVKYSNNVKAGTATITITGKGNYSGTIIKKFKINPLSLGAGANYDITTNNIEAISNHEKLSAPNIVVTGNNRVQKGTTLVSYRVTDENGKDTYVTLKNGIDYTVLYPGTESKGDGKAFYNENAFKAVNTDENPAYTAIIVGKGNYCGSAFFTETIVDKNNSGIILVSKLSVDKIANQVARDNDSENRQVKPDLVVTDTSVKGGKILTAGVDYTVDYLNNIHPGKASAIVIGNGTTYQGSKIVNFTITGVPLKSISVQEPGEGTTYNYTGQEIRPSYTLTYTDPATGNVKTLVRGVDYTETYLNNIKAGKNKAQIIFTGVGKYTGTVKKSFSIDQHVMADGDLQIGTLDADGNFTPDMAAESYPVYAYQKGGVKPAIQVKTNVGEDGVDKYVVLKEGVDYTVKYGNNTYVNNGLNEKGKVIPLPYVKITGKGNYYGCLEKNYIVTGSSLSNATITVNDVIWANKANICKPGITLVDQNGVKLAAGTDYDKNIEYRYVNDTTVSHIIGKTKTTSVRAANEPVNAADIVPVGTKIAVTVTGKGNYAGSVSDTAYFKYAKVSIAKVNVTVKDQYYTGKEVEPQLDDVTAFVKNGKLTEYVGCESFIITGYSNNVNKGTASLTIKGTGNYGGTKTVKFKIINKTLNYTINYDSNNTWMSENKSYAKAAIGSMKNSSISEGGKLTKCGFRRDGYTFAGWGTSPEGGHIFELSERLVFSLASELNSYPTPEYGKDITLYAQWVPVGYSITYYDATAGKNGVTQNNNPSTFTTEEKIVLSAPERDGYEFIGWYLDKRFTTNITTIEKGTVGNLTLYAKWR